MTFVEKILIPQDKANHFAYGAMVSATVGCIDPVWGLGACLFVAVLRELANETGFNVPDIAWTVFGGVIAGLQGLVKLFW